MATYQTVTAGTTITAAWGNNVRDGLINSFATVAARTSAVPSPATGLVSLLLDAPKRFEFYDGATWRQTGGIVECTSSTRPASPREGLRIWETDTDFELVYNGSKWIRDPYQILMVTSQSWTNTTVYTTITSANTIPAGGMAFNTEVSSRYVFELDLHTQANSGVALAVQINFPAGGNADTAYLGLNNTGSFVSGGTQGIVTGAQIGVFGGSGGTAYTRIRGQVTTVGTGGNVTFGFAQGTSNPATSFLVVGSSLRHWQVS